MSSIWTPGGERPVGRPGEAPDAQRPAEAEELTDEEMAARVEELREQLAQMPVAAFVGNVAIQFFELAGFHLSQQPPNLAEAQLAIDAMGTLVEGLAGRLDEDEQTLKDALAQLRLAFVQIRAGTAAPPPASAPPPSDGP